MSVAYEPRIGDFGVVTTGGPVGLLIRVGTLSPWNHAVIYIGDGQIVEATPRGVKISPVTDYTNIAWNQHQDLTDEQRQQIVTTAKSFVGDPYDFIDIGVLAFRILGLNLPHLFTGDVAKHKGLICSELVVKAYKSVGITLVDKPDNLVTPRDLAVYLIYQ